MFDRSSGLAPLLALLALPVVAQPVQQQTQTAASATPSASASAATPATTPQLTLPRPGIDLIGQLLEAETLALEKRAKEAIAAARAAAAPVSPANVAALDKPIALEPPPVLVGVEGPLGAPVGRFAIDGRVVLASAAAPALGSTSWRLVEIAPGRAAVARQLPPLGKTPAKVERIDLVLAPPTTAAVFVPRTGGPTAPVPIPTIAPPPAGLPPR